jgi:hypothetical protein
VLERALPDENAHDLFLIYAVLALAKGERVELADVDDAWAAWMTTRDPEHESIRPFGQLPSGGKHEDEPFVAAIRRVARRRGFSRIGASTESQS